MAAPAQPLVQGAASAAPAPRRSRLRVGWLGVAPFFAFALLFMILPIGFLVIGSFLDRAGRPTLQNYQDLSQNFIVDAYANSIEISLVSAVGGSLFGFLLAYAVIAGGLPRPLRSGLMTFCGVASNFAGVPLALAFVFTLGHSGLVTRTLLDTFHVDVYAAGFDLYTKLGLELVYIYFQFPLMVLIVAPAIDGLRREWWEAADGLGASPIQYWRTVALPVLTPTLLGTTVLLFGNAFGAQATAYQLTAGQLNLVTLVISSQMRGDVLHNVGLGYALAMGMVLIMGMCIVLYTLLQRRANRWRA